METLTGKTIIFTDLHCGLAGNRLSRLEMCSAAVKGMVERAKSEGVKNIIFGGDFFHNRSTLDLNTIDVALKLIRSLSDGFVLYLIVGNHDSYLKNSIDINSLNIFRENRNVRIVDRPEEVSVNGERFLLVPWLTDLSTYGQETFDAMVGHFEISSKYLMQAYFESHSSGRRAGKSTAAAVDADSLLAAPMAKAPEPKSSALIGNFVDLVKKGGVVYAGHIHNHKELTVRGRKFVFVGSPFEHNLGDIGDPRGYYLLDERNAPSFVQLSKLPKHVQVFASEAVKDGYDYSAVCGNIVQKVYDMDISQADDVRITRKISEFGPFEELVPDYRVSLDYGSGAAVENSSLELIRKSKVEYMRNYVDNVEQPVLDEQGLDRDKLFAVLEAYYNRVTEG